MIPKAFKDFFQSTYRNDIFHYRVGVYKKIINFNGKWQPDLIALYKNILQKIKGENKTFIFRDTANTNGWYLSEPIAKTNKSMVIFFERFFRKNINSPEIDYYDIYNFLIK
jgi:hypothetical protein